jgi:DNA-binding Xre family transcriptional regulator
MQIVRWRLREIAEPERWNPKKLADTTGLAYHTVWAIWHNRAKRADLATIASLAAILRVTPGDLLVLEAPYRAEPRHTQQAD